MKQRHTLRLGMDLNMTLFLTMAIVLFILLPFISDPKKEENIDPASQGNMIVEIYWPDELNTDIDVWITSSVENWKPVGYSSKSSSLFNLLRDDLGTHDDLSGRNMETIFSRGLPDGRYIINVHFYSNASKKLPVPVILVVSIKQTIESSSITVLRVETKLTKVGEEKTMASFEVKNKDIVKSSFNQIPKRIKTDVEASEER